MFREGVQSYALALGLITSVWLGPGCTPAQARQAMSAPIASEPDQAIAITVSHEARDVEVEAIRCIQRAIAKAHPAVRTVSPDEFRRAAFPDLPPEAAAHSTEYLALLLGDPRFGQRLAPLGIRYLVSVSGVTEHSLVGAGAGGFAGLFVWDRQTRLAASVLDLAEGRLAGEMPATASGNPWLLIAGGIPLGVPAMTESRACEQLGEAVVKFLAGRSKPESERDP